ncbi:hypothetical protein DAD186_17840 [Dermabacter vaginalis]|uniref:Uncharacterized protein n=1 Tax=Dermabacter vaginalis TaxID=1630135 RepID=A0A1B0ZJY8_9MICO|nr:hypothetical protein DAD186_17840 [Dermabacter vaginalis]
MVLSRRRTPGRLGRLPHPCQRKLGGSDACPRGILAHPSEPSRRLDEVRAACSQRSVLR